MRKKSKKPNITGHGGKRPGAGRKKTNRLGAHLRLEPETLSQINKLRQLNGWNGHWFGTNRSSIVVTAVAELYKGIMAQIEAVMAEREAARSRST